MAHKSEVLRMGFRLDWFAVMFRAVGRGGGLLGGGAMIRYWIGGRDPVSEVNWQFVVFQLLRTVIVAFVRNVDVGDYQVVATRIVCTVRTYLPT